VNRKIILLNVVLVGIVAWAVVVFRGEIRAAKERTEKMRGAKAQVTPPPPLSALPVQPPVLATGYKDVAMKTLFHPSRNPDLPPPPPPPPAPEPPPPPPLPKYHGTMNIFGNGPQALLSVGNDRTQPVSIGEMIGPFKLVDVNMVDITFDYQGQIMRRTLAQLTDRTVVAQASNDGAVARTAQPAPPPAAVIKQPMGPQGEPTAFGFKACAPNDSLPDGTVQGGYRKTTYKTPFGDACRWDPVGR